MPLLPPPPPLVRQVAEDFSWNPAEYFMRAFCLVFLPFSTFALGLDSVPAITEKFQATHLLETIDIPADGGPMDEIDIYVGRPNDMTLLNVKRFFHFNNLFTDRSWAYDVVIMVGKNKSSGIIVDVPGSAFPWCIDIFSFEGPLPPMPEEMVSGHQYSAACASCYSPRKCTCLIPRVGDCHRCQPGTCVPRVPIELGNATAAMVDRIILDISVICPMFQHLFYSVATLHGIQRLLPTINRTLLKRFIESDDSIFRRDFLKEAHFKTIVSESQMVQFSDGKMMILEGDVHKDRIRFAVPTKSDKSKIAVGKCFPFFGAASVWDMISLFNSALQSPGKIFMRDMALWNKKLVPLASRLMMMAQVQDVNNVIILVGWA